MAKCVLNNRTCSYNFTCKRCGWNEEEVEHRERLMSDNGLTLCKDGLERLIIKREESEPNT